VSRGPGTIKKMEEGPSQEKEKKVKKRGRAGTEQGARKCKRTGTKYFSQGGRSSEAVEHLNMVRKNFT